VLSDSEPAHLAHDGLLGSTRHDQVYQITASTVVQAGV